MESTIFRTTLFADELRDSEPGKVSFEYGYRHPVSIRNQKTAPFVRKLTEEEPHTIPEIYVSMGTVERIVRDDLN